jgi:hypothetical protein
MTTTLNTRMATGGGVVFCNHRDWQDLNAMPIIVASDNQNVHDWIYRYLEPYGGRGYVFYQTDSETEFLTLVQAEKPLIVFIEDCFFGDRAIGKPERICKQYPKLQLALFSVSGFPTHCGYPLYLLEPWLNPPFTPLSLLVIFVVILPHHMHGAAERTYRPVHCVPLRFSSLYSSSYFHIVFYWQKTLTDVPHHIYHLFLSSQNQFGSGRISLYSTL